MGREYDDPEREARRQAALRHIRQFGDPVLRTPASEIQVFDEALRREAEQMIGLMHEARGVGLAAPQIGRLRRLIVLDPHEDAPARALVNPTIVERSEDEEVGQEGCLSIGEVLMDVSRAVRIRVEGQDVEGNPVVIDAEDYEARVLQHEIDHLDGILILDRTPKDQRKEALRQLRESLNAR